MFYVLLMVMLVMVCVQEVDRRAAIDVVEDVGLTVVQRAEQAFPIRRLLLDRQVSIR